MPDCTRLYHNAITAPILDTALQQVNPPYLHRLHHNALTAPILDTALQQVNPPYLHRLYHNALTAPILDTALQQVNPPYLCLKLGIVKKHHKLLEKDCHTLDEKIAQSPILSELSNTSPAFQNYVKQSAELR